MYCRLNKEIRFSDFFLLNRLNFFSCSSFSLFLLSAPSNRRQNHVPSATHLNVFVYFSLNLLFRKPFVAREKKHSFVLMRVIERRAKMNCVPYKKYCLLKNSTTLKCQSQNVKQASNDLVLTSSTFCPELTSQTDFKF